MKNFLKARIAPLFGIIALVAVIGFSMVGCDLNEKDYEMLNGVWDRGDIVVTFNNDTAVFTQINSDSTWKTVQNNGYVRIGDRKFRNIAKTGDLKWSCQQLVHDTSTYVTSWEDSTITISTDGKTLFTTTATAGSSTYTKR